MAVYTLPWVGAVELSSLDVVNLGLGFALILLYPAHAVATADALPLFVFGLLAGIGVGIWAVTLWMGRTVHRIHQLLQTQQLDKADE